MINDLKKYIQLAYSNQLDAKMTSEAFDVIMSGKASDGQIGAFLIALQINGVNKNHVLGALKVMQKKMISVNVPKNSIDTCGTGGDGIGSLNVSTATAFVVAASGIPIAKHGNKALTSKCGSADVLEALNIKLIADPKKLEKSDSNCFTLSPIVYISLSITDCMASNSFSSQVEDANLYSFICLFYNYSNQPFLNFLMLFFLLNL